MKIILFVLLSFFATAHNAFAVDAKVVSFECKNSAVVMNARTLDEDYMLKFSRSTDGNVKPVQLWDLAVCRAAAKGFQDRFGNRVLPLEFTRSDVEVDETYSIPCHPGQTKCDDERVGHRRVRYTMTSTELGEHLFAILAPAI